MPASTELSFADSSNTLKVSEDSVVVVSLVMRCCGTNTLDLKCDEIQ